MRRVVILGFGRSGTTWLADIISRVLGKLVLFEPLHPSVTERSEELSYRRVVAREDSLWLKQYILSVLKKRHRKPWLMRNHVPVRIEDINPTFLDYLWQECGIAGFKEIRLNLSIPWLVQQDFGSILFVIRDPRAVVASILNRPNFWEFGWPGTYDLIVSNVLDETALAHHPVRSHADVMRRARSDVERIAVLWALSHAIAIDDCERYGIPVIRYEDIYRAPFDTVRQVIKACHLDAKPIHPSYVFSPSLTTNRTFHGIYSMDQKIERSDFSVFWERTLSVHQCSAITDIVHEFGLQYDLEERSFIRPGWRRAREIRAEELGLDQSRLVHEGAGAPTVKRAYG
jgi:hypothetical protein